MKGLVFSLFLIFILCPVYGQIILPEKEPVELEPYTRFDFTEIDESSALVASRTWENVYWTLNDSGDRARIFPVNRMGEVYRAEWYDSTQAGIMIPEAVNVDWEDMAVDNSGNLYIGAFGNNFNTRRDLGIYILKDPYPIYTSQARISSKIRFHYPDQMKYPPEKLNYDCEAIFIAFDKIHLLTKHRADTFTCLYRFDSLDPGAENIPVKTGCFDIGGMVTAADAVPDGTRLAVLTYTSVWIFESEDGDYFEGKVSWLPIKAGQCEAVCFDDDVLLISNEQGFLFEIPVSDLIELN